MNDPSNRQVQTSFGSFQSMLVVPGPKPWLPAAGVPRGAISRHAYHSAVANDDRDFFVYTPPGYDAAPAAAISGPLSAPRPRRRCRALADGGAAAHEHPRQPDRAGQGRPDGRRVAARYGTSTRARPAGVDRRTSIGYSKILLDEVMPMVDKGYNVSKNREQRAIAGLSMGGAETLYVGLNHLDKFAWIGAFSSAPMLFPASGRRRAPAAGPGGGGRGAADAHGPRGVRENIPDARRQSELADPDAVDRVRHGRRFDRRQPTVQGLAEIKGRAIHRRGSARHGPRLAAVAPEPDRHGAAAVSAEGQTSHRSAQIRQGDSPSRAARADGSRRRIEDPKIRRERGGIATPRLGRDSGNASRISHGRDPAHRLQDAGLRQPSAGVRARQRSPNTNTQNSPGACVWEFIVSHDRATRGPAAPQRDYLFFGFSILRIFDVAVSPCSVSTAVGQMMQVSERFHDLPGCHPVLSRRSLCALCGLCARLVFSAPPRETRINE